MTTHQRVRRQRERREIAEPSFADPVSPPDAELDDAREQQQGEPDVLDMDATGDVRRAVDDDVLALIAFRRPLPGVTPR